MTNAFPRPVDDFEDEFDLDMGYVASGPGGAPLPADDADAARDEGRPPLQFTPPAVAGR